MIGREVTQGLLANQGQGKITWEVVPASNFPNGLEGLEEAMREGHTWAAISSMSL